MGAPGQAFFCRQGHLYHWIGNDLWWGSPGIDDEGNFIVIPNESLWEGSRRAREEGCPCGEKDVVVLCHYGDVNDCLPEEQRLERIAVDTLRQRIPNALDAEGNPIEAFKDVHVSVYDVSRLFASRKG